VAFVASDDQVAFGAGDVLVTDASDRCVAGGQTSAAVLGAAYRRGAKVRSLPGLHAKILCFDRFTIVGSANLSESSVDSLVEAAIVTDHPGVLAEARSFIAQLEAAATEIDDRFLDRIRRIPVTRPAKTPRRAVRVVTTASRAWLVGVHQLDADRYEHEAELVEEGERTAENLVQRDGSGVSWIRFTGTSRFRREAQPGDTVIQIWRRRAKSKSARVYFAAPILHRQDEPSCTRFFVEEFADDEERAIPWAEFTRIWQMSTISEVPPLACARLLASDVAERLVALWPA
jgi:hypothetical protein